MQKRVLVGAAIALAGLAAWWGSQRGVLAQPQQNGNGVHRKAASGASAWWSASLGSAPVALSPSESSGALHRLQALFDEGSLQGASLDGGWGQWDGQSLSPSVALRRRFDQLLSTFGEADLVELRELVLALAQKDLGAAGGDAVAVIWDRYVALVGNPPAGTDGISTPQELRVAYGRLQQHRREQLGAAWAEAFFREDESLFEQTVSALENPALAPALSPAEQLIQSNVEMGASELHQKRVAEFGREAAERMREEAAYQTRWAERLGDAKAVLAKINAAPELSSSLRVVEVQRYLEAHFDGGEQVRVRALLGI